MNQKRKIVLSTSIALIVALAALNIHIFTQPQRNKACYKDLCIYSDKKPVKHLQNLVNTSNRSYLVFEGTENKTKKGSIISKATVKLTKALAQKTNITIHGISYQDGEPINCGNKTVEYCQNIEPTQKQILIHLKYPDSDQNKITLKDRKVTVETKTPTDLLATAKFISNKFF